MEALSSDVQSPEPNGSGGGGSEPGNNSATRSRYGRVHKAKTPNPEMVAFEVKRRSSIKSNGTDESLEAGSATTPVKTATENAFEAGELQKSAETPKSRNKRKAASPKASAKKRKGRASEENDTNVNAKKDLTTSVENVQTSSKSTIKQKKIQLVATESSKFYDRDFLRKIPEQIGEYRVGDIIWAKVPGYPWWPCMISIDPALGIYSKVSGTSYKADHIYHVQYFGPQPLRGWTTCGMIMKFEGRAGYNEKIEKLKANSPKSQLSKIDSKYGIKANFRKAWEQSVDEAESAIKMDNLERVDKLTFEYTAASTSSQKKKKNARPPQDIYDFDEADESGEAKGTPMLLFRKRPAQKGDFSVYCKEQRGKLKESNQGWSDEKIEEELKRKWGLLSDDLRAHYVVRESPAAKQKSDANNDFGSDDDNQLVIDDLPKKPAKKATPKTPKAPPAPKSTPKSQTPKATPAPKPPKKSASAKKKPVPAVSVNNNISVDAASETIVKSGASVKTNDAAKAPEAEKPISERFVYDSSDDLASSEDASSISDPDNELKSTNETYCAVCQLSDEVPLVACQGVCMQSFHKKCVKLGDETNDYKCDECLTG